MMKNLAAFVLSVLLAVASFVSRAEGGCPSGQYPHQGNGFQTCVPIPNAKPDGEDRPTGAVWEDRWQAVATDAAKGVIGASTNVLSQDIATRNALSDCRAKGGTQCSVDISAVNSCVSMVAGAEIMNFKAGKTQKEADKKAMDLCNSKDTNCAVLYATCSTAVRAL
jgi:hypothetical protein